jgi:SAM-dependent methyltransferase
VNPGIARALVAGSSAAVLVLEILAGRLLAPYVGVSLETFTGIIGIVLAGIAAGAWMGGAIADQRDAAPLIGSALAVGGGLTWLVLPILSALGPQFGDGTVAIVILSTAALFLPAAVLTAVSPMVAKLRLASLEDTGAVVGGLSAAGTLGALAGTFVTGFVLVSALPTRATVLALGTTLVLAGAMTHAYFTKRMPTSSALVLVLAGALLGGTSSRPCEHETSYFCANIVADEDNTSGRSLYLDGLRHAYVDLDDPTFLDIRYIRLFAQITDALPAGALDSLHIGGGGFSFPRYLQNERPGSSDIVLEIDAALVDLVEDELGLVQNDSFRVQVGDARLALSQMNNDQFDLVIGDAFASRSVPWHLTTEEFLGEVDRVLTTDGIYVMNVIDGGSFDFARAEVGTLMKIFRNVQVIIPPGGLPERGVANAVLIASQSELPPFVIDAADGTLLSPAVLLETGPISVDSETVQFWDGAESLRDDFAPVDQLQE